MYINNEFSIKAMFSYTRMNILQFLVWSIIVVFLFEVIGWKFIAIPFLPVSLIGTALSFYLGFKNNASYDRLSEARQNWEGIVSCSRHWVNMLNAYVTNHKSTDVSNEEIQLIKAGLVNRHIAWIYAHKFYLRHKRQPWEHTKPLNDRYRELYQKEFEIGTDLENDLSKYLDKQEVQSILIHQILPCKFLSTRARH